MSRWFGWLAALMISAPLVTAAQVSTATLIGVVVDESKALLPGVTVTATDVQTGRQYVDVTDERGEYRLGNVPPGTYKVQAELVGFATVAFPKVELLVGQNATLPFTLKVATIQETVTVTGESPLVDTTSSQVAGNVDRRQMEELPLQGRNWLELSMLVKGMTANNVTNTPVARDDMFQLNLDGQQITQKIAGSGFGQPKFSREAIAEFQIVTNMFDITQGRSTGIQVQAISRSGTNDLSGAFYGFFRSDQFNAADPVAKRVLPYADQQTGGAIGGPIVRDKVHYFFSYEYEREPNTIFAQPNRLAGQNFTFETKTLQNSYLGRLDWQLSSRNYFSVRASRWDWKNPFDQVAGQGHPSQGSIRTQEATNVVGTWSQVLSNTKVSELRVAYSGFAWGNLALPEFGNYPELLFPGITIGPRYNYPQRFWQDTLQGRYDLTWTLEKHNFKIGGEYLRVLDTGEWFLQRRGRMFFLSVPSDAEMARRFPADAWNNPSRWDLTGLDATVQRFDVNFHGAGWLIDIPRPTFAAWFGDTWRINDQLTVNYGVRWDDDWGATAPPGISETVIPIDNGREQGDFGYKSGIRDHKNLAPRAGFTYNVGGRNDFVIRGGSGLFYAVPVSNVTFSHQIYNQMIAGSIANDGRPGFVLDPLRGRTADDFLSGRVAVPVQAPRIIDPKFVMPYTWQSSLGFQKQLGPVMAIEADLNHWTWHNDTRTRDVNLFYDPTTGYNRDPRFGRPNPNYSQVTWFESTGRRDYLALATGLTRRYRDNFQGGVTYTVTFYMRDNGTIGYTQGDANNQFDHLDGEWARSTDFQRNTLRAWAMYQLPWGFSLSGVYFYGSGNYYSTNHASVPYGKPGTNRLNLGAPITIPESLRDRFDGPDVIGTGQVVPRNALRGLPLHKVDVRVSKEFKLRDMRASLFGEVFNLFNHANYGSFVGQVNSATLGQPRQQLGNAYVPRSGQLGFRVAF
ncbi:MAG: TonB-dependent receptor [Acidobacteria bacterium]|nr:TonB-dependent receptor [Acidobacteriota bacterium]